MPSINSTTCLTPGNFVLKPPATFSVTSTVAPRGPAGFVTVLVLSAVLGKAFLIMFI